MAEREFEKALETHAEQTHIHSSREEIMALSIRLVEQTIRRRPGGIYDVSTRVYGTRGFDDTHLWNRYTLTEGYVHNAHH